MVFVAFALRYSLLSETFVSIIFLSGAVFVFIEITVQARLLGEMRQTIQGLLPICVKCKKIRVGDDNPKDPTIWRRIESYISERIDVDFSHGYCPECYDEEYDVYTFTCNDGDISFEDDIDEDDVPQISDSTDAYCNKCAWHGKIEKSK